MKEGDIEEEMMKITKEFIEKLAKDQSKVEELKKEMAQKMKELTEMKPSYFTCNQEILKALEETKIENECLTKAKEFLLRDYKCFLEEGDIEKVEKNKATLEEAMKDDLET